MRSLQRENQRLKKIVAELENDKSILKQSLDFEIRGLRAMDLHVAVTFIAARKTEHMSDARAVV